MTNTKNGSSFVFFIILTIVGLFMNYLSGDMIKKGEESLKWPKTKGVVIESAVSKYKNSEGSETYYPKVIVKYNVKGYEYETSKIDSSISYSTSDQSSVQETVSKYRKGSYVDVYYNNQNFGEAVLEPGVTKLAKIFRYGSFALLLIAAIILLKWLFIVSIFGVFIANVFFKKKDRNIISAANQNSNSINRNPVQPNNSNLIQRNNISSNNNDDGFSL